LPNPNADFTLEPKDLLLELLDLEDELRLLLPPPNLLPLVKWTEKRRIKRKPDI